MGTGKSLVGQRVAELLGWEYVDTDTDIECKAGKSVRAIFAEDGERAFRAMEKQALQEACSQEHKVISTGGGAVLDPDNRELMLNKGLVVCLDALPETIYRRLLEDNEVPVEDRPLLAGPDPLKQIQELKTRRHDFYAVAHRTVHTDELTIEQMAQQVVQIPRTLRQIKCNWPIPWIASVSLWLFRIKIWKTRT